MKNRADWLLSRCVSLVLVELAKKPGTPMDIRARTGLTKNNYVNIILKRLEGKGIVKCLNPEERIGKVLCINPATSKKVENIFTKSKISQNMTPLPKLNWEAYGRLLCRYCTQLRTIFYKSNELRKAGKEITVFNLKENLPKMATGDIYRALNRLIGLGIMVREDSMPKKFIITKEGFAIIHFDPQILVI